MAGTRSIAGTSTDTADERHLTVAVNGAAEDDEEEAYYPTAEEIMAMSDTVIRVVRVQEWAKEGRPAIIPLHSLNGDQRDKYLNSVQYTDAKGRQRYDFRNSNARLVQMSAKKKDGSRLFAPGVVDALNQKNAGVLERLAKIVRDISGLSNLEEEEEQRARESLD